MRIVVSGSVGNAHGPLPFKFIQFLPKLSGRKRWHGSKRVQFEASGANIRLLQEAFPEAQWEDETGELAKVEEMAALATQHSAPDLINLGQYKPALALFPHQEKALALGAERESYAYLLEMGLGKTAIAIANAGHLHAQRKVDGVLVVAPKGVTDQWIESEIPRHMDRRVLARSFLLSWKGKQIDFSVWQPGRLNVFAINIDALRTEKGYQSAFDFLETFEGKSMMILDESHLIKNGSAQRTKATWALGAKSTYRRIMTGTPMSRNVVDAWSQFRFLDPRITGHSYMTSFRSRYCMMGGFEGKQIIGHKNIEEFYGLIAPHSFRLTKEEALDLPDKNYAQRVYELDGKSEKHYRQMKAMMLTALEDGTIVDAANAMAAMLRLQQIVCGYLPIDENSMEVFSDQRLLEMSEIIDQREGPIVIWARFNQDIERIADFLRGRYPGEPAVTYYGATSRAERAENAKAFVEGRARFFVSNPAAGGTGLNLQGACQTVIYYSNSFDALHRWQSEDRTHRMGTTGPVTYFDLVAKATVDRAILGNLRLKRSVSSMTFDDIRKIING